MSLAKIIIGVAVCLAALFAGCTIGLAMGGFGICAISFSASMVGFSSFVGALFGGIVALLWRKVWWAGAAAFSIPTLLGAAFGAAGGKWERVIGIGVCILAAAFTAFVVRYPSPGSLKE